MSYLQLHAFYKMLLCNFLWDLLPFVKAVKGDTEYTLFTALILWEEIFLGYLTGFFTIKTGHRSGGHVSDVSETRNTWRSSKFSVPEIAHVPITLTMSLHYFLVVKISGIGRPLWPGANTVRLEDQNTRFQSFSTSVWRLMAPGGGGKQRPSSGQLPGQKRARVSSI